MADQHGGGSKKAKVWAALRVGGLLAVVLLLPILGGTAVYYDWWGAVAGLYDSGDGRIIVNSPTVYTRQRLVNDRLTQNAWLEAQLEATKDLSTFRAIDAIQHSYDERALAVQATLSAKIAKDNSKTDKDSGTDAKKGTTSEAKDVPQGDGQSALKPEPTTIRSGDSYEIQPTTDDLFRAVNDYREEVRSEIIQTQLDDRHDILGNTVYRLAVDVTVLAGRKTDKLALVNVILRYNPNENLDRYQADDEIVYGNWLRYVQRIVSDSVDGVAKTMMGRTLDPRVRVRLPYFLARTLCKSIETAASPGDGQTGEGCDVWRAQRSPEVDLSWRILDSYISKYLERRQDIIKARFERDLRAVAIAKHWRPEDFPYAFDFANRGCNLGQLNEADIQGSTGVDQVLKVKCPIYTFPDEGIIAGLNLYDYLVTHPFALHGLVQDPLTVNDPEVIATKLLTISRSASSYCKPGDEAACIVPDLTRGQFSCAAAEYIVWSLNAFEDPHARPEERIEFFLDLKSVGRQSHNCDVVVNPLSDQHGIKQDVAVSAKHLAQYLNSSDEVYAYSVTPKNLSERISTSTGIGDAVELLLNAKADTGVADATSWSSSIRKHSEDLRGVQQQAIVVGFSQSLGIAKSTPPYETSFGWALGPHLGVDGAKAQVDEQYGLAALISVPSWWRSVELDVQTCWINRRDLQPPAEKPEDACVGKTVLRKDIVRLPGFANDISRKLGFDIIQEPHLDPYQQPQILQAGYPADILLRGGRLWRSTAVTLGSQQAKSISVLPDMEGIVAHFDCVLPQFGWSPHPNAPFQVPVTVWTSEGEAPLLDPEAVQVEVPEGFWDAAAKHEPCKVATGQAVPPSPPASPAPATQPYTPAQASTGQAAPQTSSVSLGPTAKLNIKGAEGTVRAR